LQQFEQERSYDQVHRYRLCRGLGVFGTGYATSARPAVGRYDHYSPRSMWRRYAPCGGRLRVECRRSPRSPRRPQVRQRSDLLRSEPTGRGLPTGGRRTTVDDRHVGSVLVLDRRGVAVLLTCGGLGRVTARTSGRVRGRQLRVSRDGPSTARACTRVRCWPIATCCTAVG
jgi:hypothetical protein